MHAGLLSETAVGDALKALKLKFIKDSDNVPALVV